MQERSKIKASRESHSTLPVRFCANPTKAANASPYQVNWRGLWASAKAIVIKLKSSEVFCPAVVCDKLCHLSATISASSMKAKGRSDTVTRGHGDAATESIRVSDAASPTRRV